jgi:hypothetical protein
VPAIERLELLALFVSLAFLRVQPFLPGKRVSVLSDGRDKGLLFRSHRFEFCGLLSVLSTASRTASVEIFFDMMPAEVADLVKDELWYYCTSDSCSVYLVAAGTGFEVQVREVHLFETERALQVLLQGDISTYTSTATTDTQLRHRSSTRLGRPQGRLTWRATRW